MEFWPCTSFDLASLDFFLLLACSLLLAIACSHLFHYSPNIYLVDFACFRPPSSWRIPFASFIEHSKLAGSFDDRSLDFQRKIFQRSGLSELTAMPNSLHYIPPRINMFMERQEAQTVLFGALDELFRNVHVKPEQISVLIVNCSLFTPTPSIASMIVNKYKLRHDIKSFNLAGMGCSAGLISLDLAKNFLKVVPNSYAVILSTENLTRNWYFGNERPMLVTNCIFRVGGSAILLSNHPSDKRRAKYKLIHTLRTHTAADDKYYKCVFQEEDDQGFRGVNISKDLMYCAAKAMESNIRTLGPKVLPTGEILRFAANLVARKVFQANVKPYVPNFRKAFDHICIHAGGKAVIKEMEKSLNLMPEVTEPSRMTLHRFGNVSSSSVWYELAYEEAKGRVKRGHKVWQIGLGSGFKCCSSVLKAIKTIHQPTSGCWADCIYTMPVELPEDGHASKL